MRLYGTDVLGQADDLVDGSGAMVDMCRVILVGTDQSDVLNYRLCVASLGQDIRLGRHWGYDGASWRRN